LDRTPIAIAVLVGAVLLAFSPWWLGGRLIAPLDIVSELHEPWAAGDTTVEVKNHFTTDAVTQYLEYRAIAERAFAQGNQVGWNPLSFGGNPEYANTMAAHGDWSMQLHRVFGFWTAWHLGLMGHFLVAGIGMWVFLRSRSVAPAVSLLASLAYLANTQFVLWIFHRWQLAAFAWLPWVLWAILRFVEGRRRIWPLIPAFLGLAALGGTLQQDAFIALALLAVWSGLVLTSPGQRLRLTAHFAAWTILGFALAAFTLVPAVLAFADNVTTGHVRGALGEGWSPLSAALSVVFLGAQPIPGIFGSPQTIDLSKILGRSLFDVASIGLVPTLVAYRSLLLREAPAPARALMLTGLVVPLTPLVGPLYFRVQIVFVLGAAWAFAWYWEHASDRLASFERRLASLIVIALGLWCLAGAVVAVAESQISRIAVRLVSDRLSQGEGTFAVFRDWMLGRAGKLVHDFPPWTPSRLPTMLVAVLGAIALRARNRHAASSHALILIALAVELGAFAISWVTAVDPQRYPPYPVTPDILTMTRIVGDGRVVVINELDRPVLFPPNTLVMYGVANIDQYESIRPPSMWQETGFSLDADVLGALAVTHAITHPDSTPAGEEWELRHRGSTLAVWANTAALPRFMALGTIPTDWQLAKDLKRAATPFPPVKVVSSSDNRRLLTVPQGTRVLRIAENWSPGWQYRLPSGRWTAVARAPDGSMLLEMAAAREPLAVELAFRPQRRTAGELISAVAALSLAAAGWSMRSRRTRTLLGV
jgi:hypothetical protein